LRGLVFLVMVVGVVAGAYFGTIKVHTVAAPPKYYYEGYGEFSPGFTPTKENHRSAWIWLPCALIAVGVEFMVMLLVMLLVGVAPDGSP